jgi:hypothetical protein
MDRPTITVIVIEAPNSAANVYVVDGAADDLELGHQLLERNGVTVHTVFFDTYPATLYCTEPGEYTEFPAQAERLAARLDDTEPSAAAQLRVHADEYRKHWPGHTA